MELTLSENHSSSLFNRGFSNESLYGKHWFLLFLLLFLHGKSFKNISGEEDALTCQISIQHILPINNDRRCHIFQK
jgi:hypothetical protein